MAGIGVKLNNIYGKNTLTTDVIGMGYSTVMTIAPMLTVTVYHGIFPRFFFGRICDKGAVFLYGALYLYLCTADGIAF